MVEGQTRGPQKAVPTGREGSTPSLVTRCPGGERDIMALFERAGPGSIPGRGTDEDPWSVVEARDRAKVVGEVRLLTGILWPNPKR